MFFPQVLAVFILSLLCQASQEIDDKYAGFPKPLTEENFKLELANGLHVVEFFSPYCSHCKQLEPKWKEAWLQMKDEGEKLGITLNQIDCVASGDLCVDEDIEYFPTLRLYGPNGFIKNYPASGKRNVASIVDFAKTEAINPDNLETLTNKSESRLIDDAEFVEMISGEAAEPYFVSFWPTETMDDFDSYSKFIGCENCSPFQRTWMLLSNRLLKYGIKSAHLNCAAHQQLCSKLGFDKLLKFDDEYAERHPRVALVLPNKTTNNLFVYDDGFTADVTPYEAFAKSIYTNNKPKSITNKQLEEMMYYKLDFSSEAYIPLNSQKIHLVFSYDPKTVVSEDFEIFEYLLHSLSRVPNVELRTSQENVMTLVRDGYEEFYSDINRYNRDSKRVLDEAFFTLTTLTQSPTFVLFKDGDVVPHVFHGYSTTEMRNPDLIMSWVMEHSKPLISKVDHTNVEELTRTNPEIYDSLTLLCVDTSDKESQKQSTESLDKFLAGYHDFEDTRMKFMFEKILNRRGRKQEIIKGLRDKNTEIDKIVGAMRIEIVHEDDRKTLLGYVDVSDVDDLLARLQVDANVARRSVGDVFIIDTKNKKLIYEDVSQSTLNSTPNNLRDTLISINIPEKADSEAPHGVPIRIFAVQNRRSSGLSFRLGHFVLLALIIIVTWKGAVFLKHLKINRIYKAKRNTTGLLGTTTYEKKNFQD
ncbi:protein disulfide isomerase EPS1 KNAG_0E03560 [Huiozyma naganishii CBS 8797]|uniref:Thioredoxin domain-containing protein n=1 Tax=Huiozyma naganishii (strain ATCC MYA-139 / BCRC 22969 / CBS 8797 / KCTC 17520 / NBRC 10181 / NCYC 3082 / Yp74L-3) TaxID=1071383 RepID=J7RM46_HUIN7|nr:hypothetical protein KNAG_0E03560 [Kazachstania naganishii CBS 8797]CCK70613.1 hypothetical protein KNAG_0E03560 [Kazachstania naganishii CBS 8797]